MEPTRYRFENIFDTSLTFLTQNIKPKFNVVINGVRFNQGASITKDASFGGLNLFNYIGHDLAGIWNNNTRELTIVGFY